MLLDIQRKRGSELGKETLHIGSALLWIWARHLAMWCGIWTCDVALLSFLWICNNTALLPVDM